MTRRILVSLAASLLTSCSSPSRTQPPGHIVVALTTDWEGAEVSSEVLEVLDDLRKRSGDAPITHFVSSAYFTKADPDPGLVATLSSSVRKGDELAVHLHGWRSLAAAAGVVPKLSPSYLTGTDKLLAFDDGDTGFDTDLDVYSIAELRAILRTSRKLLEQAHLPISKSFRAGGYLGTPKVLQAIFDEGYTTDSSATDYRNFDQGKEGFLARRLRQVWPKHETTTQPSLVAVTGGQVLEMPIAAFADYASAAQMIAVFEAAHARLRAEPGRDVFIVLGFDLEGATEFGARISEAIEAVRKRPELTRELLFTTIDGAAALARRALEPAPGN